MYDTDTMSSPITVSHQKAQEITGLSSAQLTATVKRYLRPTQQPGTGRSYKLVPFDILLIQVARILIASTIPFTIDEIANIVDLVRSLEDRLAKFGKPILFLDLEGDAHLPDPPSPELKIEWGETSDYHKDSKSLLLPTGYYQVQYIELFHGDDEELALIPAPLPHYPYGAWSAVVRIDLAGLVTLIETI